MAQQKNNGCGCFLFLLLAAGGGWYWYSDGNFLSGEDPAKKGESGPLAEVLTPATPEECELAEEQADDEAATDDSTAESAPAPAPEITASEASSLLPPLHIALLNNTPGIPGEINAIRTLIAHLDKAEMAKYLEEKGITPDKYLASMLEAIRQGDADLVIRLLACGTPTDKKDENYVSAHRLLLSKGDLTTDVIHVLVAADVTEPDKLNEKGKNILLEAWEANAAPTVMSVLKELGCTYGSKLHTAAIYGDIEAAKAALDEGQSVNDGSEHGYSPLCMALIHKDTELFKLLLNKGADLNQFVGEGNFTLLEGAILSKNVEAAKLLIEAKIDVNLVHEKNKKNRTPLIRACSTKETQALVPALLDAGADFSATDRNKENALHLICESIYDQQSVEVLRSILSRNPDIHQTNKNGFTPLLKLASKFHKAYGDAPEYDKQAVLDALNELLKAGADPHAAHAPGKLSVHIDAKGYDGAITALKYAEFCNATECIEILDTACKNTKPSLASRLSGAISVKEAVAMLEKYDLLDKYNPPVTNPFYTEIAYQEASDMECIMSMMLLKAPPPCYYKRRVKEFDKHFKMLGDKMENINDYAYLSAIYILSDWAATYASTSPQSQILEKATIAFIAAGHDINKVSSKADDGKLLTSMETPLITATRCNNADMVRLLLELGADANAKNEKGATARDIAKADNKTNVLKVLDELAPAPAPEPAPAPQPATEESAESTTSVSTPQPAVAEQKSEAKTVSADALEKLKPLYNRLARLKCKEEYSALCQKRLLHLLDNIRNGGDINMTTEETKGSNALHYSCSLGSLSITKWLLENGADSNAKTAAGADPITCVGDDNRDAIIALLKQFGARANEGKAEQGTSESTPEENAAPVVLFNEDDTPTEETTNNVVCKRFTLMATPDVTLDSFKDVFADEVIELKSSKVVSVTTLHEKAQQQNEKWPSRAVKLLDMGVSGRRIEANVALVYKNPANGKSISAYNKVVMLLNENGKICGMSETISSKRSKLSRKFKSVKFTGEDPVFAVSE